jgi:hypothetical protein
MTNRIGVFATDQGWRVVQATRQDLFESRAAALNAARRWAHLARWRGADVEVLAQERLGGPLARVELPTPSIRKGGVAEANPVSSPPAVRP